VGGKFQTNEQRADMALVARDVENSGLLDYVTGWYFKAADYIQGCRIVVGFVSDTALLLGKVKREAKLTFTLSSWALPHWTPRTSAFTIMKVKR
jgi:hypothetical protein